MSPTSSKTPYKQFGSPTTPLEPGILESSTNSNMSQTPGKTPPQTPIKTPPQTLRKNPPRAPIKKPPSTRKSNVKDVRTGVKPPVRRKLFPISEDVKMTGNLKKLSVKSVAEEASRAFSNKSLNNTKNTLERLIYEKFTFLKNQNLNPTDRGRLARTISSVSSIENVQNISMNNVQTLSNHLNVLEKIETKYKTTTERERNTALGFLNESQQIIKKLVSRLNRVENKHKKATSLVSKLVKETKNKNEETVPITKRTVIRNTSEINRLTRQMEKLKGVSNSERSKLLSLIVSLTKKQKGLRNTLSKLKNVAVSKKSNVDEFKEELQDYKTKIQQYENLVKKLRENASTRKPSKKTKKLTKKTPSTIKKTPVKPPKTNFLSNNKMGATVQKESSPTGTDSQTSSPTTPNNQYIKKDNNPPSITEQHGQAKKQGATEASKERQERWKREGTPRARRSLEPIFNKMAKSPKTPPGITKSNLQQFLAPFKQPISIQFAPSIKATGGNATVTQIKTNKDDKKKKTPKKFNILADPASAYRKSVVASKRKEIMPKLRTPTVGQRKKHVIQLIDKELRLMKVPKDIERKMISLYSKVLSEKQIKQLFGGRSTGDVKKILKKQVDYFKKKKR